MFLAGRWRGGIWERRFDFEAVMPDAEFQTRHDPQSRPAPAVRGHRGCMLGKPIMRPVRDADPEGLDVPESRGSRRDDKQPALRT
ncbi:hypothetical protein [Sphingomonas sp. Leaf231]|uniref:hypothetical protein n=1 Tax=Sphingomonas sp. Leaf231 TaxID=1736301 RepID=UPI0012E2C048|nr:hypothetical protein [Sphingomonas sp. Leaf231]